MPISHTNYSCSDHPSGERAIFVDATEHVRLDNPMLRWLFSARYECGHRASSFGYRMRVTSYANTSRVIFEPDGTRERCPSCAAQHVYAKYCRCFVCGHVILPGSSISILPLTRDREYSLPARTGIVQTPHGPHLLACARWECTYIGVTGFWDGDAYRGNQDEHTQRTILLL